MSRACPIRHRHPPDPWHRASRDTAELPADTVGNAAHRLRRTTEIADGRIRKRRLGFRFGLAGPPEAAGPLPLELDNHVARPDPLRRRDARSQPGTPGKGLLCLVSKDPDSPPGQLKGKDVDALSVPGRKRENHVIGIGGSLSAILFAAGHPASLKSWARFARMSMPEAGAFLTTFLLPALRRDPHPVPGAATRIQPGC